MIVPPRDLADRAESAFARLHGRPASFAARAPGRVNVIGEHTDYLGGRCLPLALPYATWVVGRPRTDDVLRLTSGADLTWEGSAGEALDPRRPLAPGWQAYVLGTLRALGRRQGLDLHVESTVPRGAGLSSSASLVCAVAAAVSDRPLARLVAPCVAAEQVHVGAPTGGMDQTVALRAVEHHALVLDFADPSAPAVRPVPWRPETSGLELLVVDTGIRHDNADGTFGVRRREAETALTLTDEALTTAPEVLRRRRRHVTTENERVDAVVEAAASARWDEVGALMGASHASLRDDFEVSCRELDLVVEEALGAGALGARMTGGGFGGCAVVLVAQERREVVARAVTAAALAAGHPEPTFLTADANGPALRLGPTAPSSEVTG